MKRGVRCDFMITKGFIEKVHYAFDELNYHESKWLNFDTVTYFYGHSFSLDYKPPNISPFRLWLVAQRKSEVNGKNCY